MAIAEKTFTSELPTLLTSLFGTKGSTTQKTSANTGPLESLISQAQQPMSPQLYQQLIAGIFNTAAQQVPTLTAALANATGTRSSNNSPLALALNEQNNQAANLAAGKILDYNQNQQKIAMEGASNLGQLTRSTSGTTTAGKPGMNPLLMTGLGWALNKADKAGMFGGASAGAASTVDPISNIDPWVYSQGGPSTGVYGQPVAFEQLLPQMAPDFNFETPMMDVLGGADLGGLDFGSMFGGGVDFGGAADAGSEIVDIWSQMFADGGLLGSRGRQIDAAEAAAVNGQDPNQAVRAVQQQSMAAPQFGPGDSLLQLLLRLILGGQQPAAPRMQGPATPASAPAKFADGGVIRNRNNMGPMPIQQGVMADPQSAGGISGGLGLNSSQLLDMWQRARGTADQSVGDETIYDSPSKGAEDSPERQAEIEAAIAADAANGYSQRNAVLNSMAFAVANMALAGAAPALAQQLQPAMQMAQATGIAPKSPMGLMTQMAFKNIMSQLQAAPETGGPIGLPAEGSIAVHDSTTGAGMSSVPDLFGGGLFGPAPNQSLDPNPGGVDLSNSGLGNNDAPTPGDSGTPFSDGGKLNGPGTGTSDSMTVKPKVPGAKPVGLSTGEGILPEDTVRQVGWELLQRLIDLTHAPVRR